MLFGTTAWASTVQSSKIYHYKLASTEIQNQRPIKYVYSTDWLKGYAGEMAVKYGLSGEQYTQMMATIMCESGFQIDPKHNNISWGITQFTPPTWKGFGYGDIMNPVSQLDVMASMWSRGLESRWDCYRLGLYKKYLTSI